MQRVWSITLAHFTGLFCSNIANSRLGVLGEANYITLKKKIVDFQNQIRHDQEH